MPRYRYLHITWRTPLTARNSTIPVLGLRSLTSDRSFAETREAVGAAFMGTGLNGHGETNDEAGMNELPNSFHTITTLHFN